jgi:hypothetical protein
VSPSCRGQGVADVPDVKIIGEARPAACPLLHSANKQYCIDDRGRTGPRCRTRAPARCTARASSAAARPRPGRRGGSGRRPADQNCSHFDSSPLGRSTRTMSTRAASATAVSALTAAPESMRARSTPLTAHLLQQHTAHRGPAAVRAALGDLVPALNCSKVSADGGFRAVQCSLEQPSRRSELL